MNNPSQKISVVEKIGYSLGDLAANLVFQTLVFSSAISSSIAATMNPVPMPVSGKF